MSLKNLAKMVKDAQKERDPLDKLKYHYYKQIIENHPPRKPKEDMFSPSSLNKSDRELYYRICGYEPEPRQNPVHLQGSWNAIMESGTDAHERIQRVLSKLSENKELEFEWIDVADYIEQFKPEGTSVIEKQGMETKLFSDVISARFLSDGVIKYEGKYYIIEIKTMNERKWNMAYKQGHILDEHVMQASAYSIALGIDDVIYIYENRNNNQLLLYDRHVSDEDKKEVLRKIHRVQTYKKLGKVPPKPKDPNQLRFFEYPNRSERDGETEDIFEGVDPLETDFDE